MMIKTRDLTGAVLAPVEPIVWRWETHNGYVGVVYAASQVQTMCCYVTSKLGNEVDIPKELM